MIMRGGIALLVVAALVLAIVLVQGVQDIDLPPTADTVGMVAAVEYLPNGSRVVLIKPDGTIVRSPGYKDGANDREPVWRPDGNRLFFSSDRDDGQVHLFRWNPASNKVERRTLSKGTYTNLVYSQADQNARGLVASGGKIVEFDPVGGAAALVLPPTARAVQSNPEEGATSSMDIMYGRYGNSFKKAAWFGGKKYVAAILKGDRGETLILQPMEAKDGRIQPPLPVSGGDRIDMDVSPKTGQLVFTVQGFRFPDPDQVPPEFVKNGKVVPPFRHFIGMIEPNEPQKLVPIAQIPNDQNVFADPVISPDGSKAIMAVGVYGGVNNLHRTGLLSMTLRGGGAGAPAGIHKGPVYNYSFSGDGQQIAYVERGAGDMQIIHVMDADGSHDKALTTGKGSFGEARFSPQTKG
ncbi:MAG: hypothetical protein QOJ65_566 [Fimbriimonadaceae bacterium]|nr:hypothetical protein [Fimbriimonadaceae bacterium]